MLQSCFSHTLLDGIECRYGIASAVFEPHEDASVFLMRFQGNDFKIVRLDEGEEGREAFEKDFFAKYTYIVAEATTNVRQDDLKVETLRKDADALPSAQPDGKYRINEQPIFLCL